MVGSTKSQKINVRVISATNSDVEEQIRQGHFREDLFYRLNVISVHIPPLRERESDIDLLVRHFNRKFSQEMGKKPLKINARVMEVLRSYSWPGNVRELENFIQRMVIMSDTELDLSDIPTYMKMRPPTMELEAGIIPLAEFEKKYISKVLLLTNNNKTKAAEILGIDRKTLREKLKNT